MKQTFLRVLAIIAMTMGARATSILNEPFAYTDGPLTTVSSGAWVTHSGTGGEIPVASGAISLSQSKTEDVNRTLTGAPYNTGTLYASFKINLSTLPSGAGNYFAHFKDTGNSNFRARVFVSTTGAAAGQYRVGIASGGAVGSAAFLPTDLALNTDYTVVIRYGAGSPVSSTIWLNPTAETDSSISATDSSTVLAISTFALRQSNSGGGMGVMTLDDLKIGTDFADVVGGNPGQTPPIISSIANQTIPQNGSSAPISFTVGDVETPAGSLVLSSSSSNTGLVPTSNIVFGGSDSNRTVTITPVPGQTGTANVAITVTDAGNLFATTSFSVNVVSGNGAPVISSIGWTNTLINVPLAGIPFTISDPETPGAALALSASSSDTNLLPTTGIVFGGSDNNRTVSLTPANGQTGVAVVTLAVSDGTNSASTTFAFMVVPSASVILNDSFIYADGSVVTNSAFMWNTHSGTAGQVQVTGGQLQVLASQSEDINAPLIGAPFASGNGTVLYVSIKAKLTTLPTTAAGEYFAHFKDASSGFRARIRAGTTDAAPGTFRLGIANSTATSAQVPMDLNLNTTYTVVARYDVDAGTSTLWVDPVTESDTTNSVAATDAVGTGAITSFAFREAAGFGAVVVDDLKVGTSFASVVSGGTTLPSPIPLSIVVSGGAVTVSWTNAAFKLQSSTGVAGPFSDVPGATSPYTTSTTGTEIYFRLKY